MALTSTDVVLRRPARWPGQSRLSDPVPWVAGLFLATFLLQRFTAPGLPVPVTVPLAVGWLVLAGAAGVVEFNRNRLLLWLGAAGVTGLLVTLQPVVLAKPFVSVTSWALWLVVWLPLVVQLQRRDQQTYLRCTRAIGHVGVGLAGLSLLFLGSQVLGLRYYDWLATVVPANLLVPDYVITYPVVYGSSLYKSNGWIALEPSFMSFFLGVALICALLARMSILHVVLITAGLLSTVAGSGLALVAVFLLVLAVQRRLGTLRRYLIPGAAIGVLFATTILGEAVLSRVTEAGAQNSSTSLRSIEPYVQLWPHWIVDPVGMVIGYGPGSSADLVSGLGITGLLVPSVAKLLFDYGLIGGALLIALMVSTYLRGPSSAFAISLAASMFLLQAASPPLVICSVIAISLWSPAVGAGQVAQRRLIS